MFFVFLGFSLWFIGIIWSVYVPDDRYQGVLVKIMFVHVPSSWWALGFYTLMACFSLLGVVFRYQIYFLMAKSMAPVGLTFSIISLLTGSLWGHPAWGTWWVWDARLTSMLFLVFLYIGYINLMQNKDVSSYTRVALIQILGWINVPFIKWSVEWWSTLHQPASIKFFNSAAIHQYFLYPLMFMVLSLFLIGVGISMMFLVSNLISVQVYRKEF